MVTNSIVPNASVPSAPRDSGKKKRANRSAKLKQCKLDARREQWLSHGTVVKNKGCEEEQQPVRVLRKERKKSLESLENGHEEENANGSIHLDFDLDSPSNSPTSSSSVLCGTDSGTNFTASSSSVSSRSGGCYSGNVTEEEGEEDGGGDGDDDDDCLDDWEAVADALAASDDNKQQNSSNEPSNLGSHCSPVCEPMVQQAQNLTETDLRQESPGRMLTRLASGGGGRAWRADDEFRPQSLPNLAKQRSFPNTDRRYGLVGGIPWGRTTSAVNVPSSCPICCEDLDYTDSSFLPCPCEYRLCLFCHKRILETDGRCPGCRKPYEKFPVDAGASINGESLTFRLARSCSMIARS